MNFAAFNKLAWVLMIAALASPTVPCAAAPMQPFHQGYAFDQPRILAQQRLFGIAHGITLLAAACGRETPTHDFAEWNERQAETIEASQRILARYYFGDRAAEATPLDIARALGLKDALSIKPGSAGFAAACATFGAALHKPRYDLRDQFHLQFLAARLAAATLTEAESAACRQLLVDDEQMQLDEAMARWHAKYDAGLEEAKTTLEQRGPDLLLGGSLEEWLAAARENGRKAASAERCKTMPARLLTRKLDPDDAFNTEP